MKILVGFAAIGLLFAQAVEPNSDNVFYALVPNHFIDLERQTAKIHTSAHSIVVATSAKSTAQIKPGKSPERLSASNLEFVVRSPLAATSSDLSRFFVLRKVEKKGGKREIVITKVRAYSTIVTSSATATTNLDEGQIPITFTKFGEHSVRIVPNQPLTPGEYALSTPIQFMELFCFGVD
jgi:hypothetical protein